MMTGPRQGSWLVVTWIRQRAALTGSFPFPFAALEWWYSLACSDTVGRDGSCSARLFAPMLLCVEGARGGGSAPTTRLDDVAGHPKPQRCMSVDGVSFQSSPIVWGLWPCGDREMAEAVHPALCRWPLRGPRLCTRPMLVGSGFDPPRKGDVFECRNCMSARGGQWRGEREASRSYASSFHLPEVPRCGQGLIMNATRH
jgi:hypothetical protein